MGVFFFLFMGSSARLMYGTCQELEFIERGKSRSRDVLKDRSNPRGAGDGVARPVNMSVSLGNASNCTWRQKPHLCSVATDCMCELTAGAQTCVCLCLCVRVMAECDECLLSTLRNH